LSCEPHGLLRRWSARLNLMMKKSPTLTRDSRLKADLRPREIRNSRLKTVDSRLHFDRRGHPTAPVTTLVYDFLPGHNVPEHFHEYDQLVFATSGVMTVRTSEGAWVVPTQRAVWIPAQIPHSINMSGAVSMRTLYFKPRLVRGLPRSCRVVNVSPLLKELVIHACRYPALDRRVKPQSHLVAVIVDQLECVQSVPLQLTSPSDPRARRVAELLFADPGDQRSLREICKVAGASKRTIERLFQQEAHMSFGRWRQQLRLMQAMRLLAEGQKITHAALEAGYSTPSAFISMFRRVLGTTPGRYFSSG
jgi:AraC-like DNA-binding protein/quercetin dioxygenase-like cupin family protein